MQEETTCLEGHWKPWRFLPCRLNRARGAVSHVRSCGRRDMTKSRSGTSPDGGCRRILRVLRGQDAALTPPPQSATAFHGGERSLAHRPSFAERARVHPRTLAATAYGNFSEDLRADELMSTPSRPSGVRALLALPDRGIAPREAPTAFTRNPETRRNRASSLENLRPTPKFAEQP